MFIIVSSAHSAIMPELPRLNYICNRFSMLLPFRNIICRGKIKNITEHAVNHKPFIPGKNTEQRYFGTSSSNAAQHLLCHSLQGPVILPGSIDCCWNNTLLQILLKNFCSLHNNAY